MEDPIQKQIRDLRRSIAGLEPQRDVLGDEIIDPALKALRGQLDGLEAQIATQAAPAEERRLVTILFMDMVGSTSKAEEMDPEEWRQVVSKLHTALGAAVAAHRGTVAQYLGDGLLAFFGARGANEADPENAIRAALDGQIAVANLLMGENVQLRAGIHSGLVVVGELGDEIHQEFTASGDAMNLAARLQSAAPPGGILISHDTYRYVRGVFDLTPRPPLVVKGKSEPLQTYLVRRAKPRPFRSVARGVAGVETPTIGREAEMQALQAAYLRAYEGHGVVWAQLVSEPGVGKSRLMADLSDWIDLRDEKIRLLRARAFPDDDNQPFALVRRMWLHRFQITDDTPLDLAEAKWVERFRELSGKDDSDEPAHALGLLVGLPFESSPHIKGMRNDPEQVKGRALVVSRELLQAVRREHPAVVLLEDMQWTDTASWEYLVEVFLGGMAGDWSIEQPDPPPKGLFILGAARPEWRPPEELMTLFDSSAGKGSGKWGTLITLAPLTDQATRDLARELLQRAVEVPEQLIDLLVERSEGVPYFAEELVNWLIDHSILDTRSEPWRFFPDRLKEQPLPATLQHLLLTRLGSLSQPERAALQRGAIFGRRFWTGGLEALGVSAGAETLESLRPRGFVEALPESAFQGDTEWSFHQNLLQEVTYESVLKRERAGLHKVAAGWLERQARQAGRLDEFAGLLGDHCERAGELGAAANWYRRAGQRAFSQGAPREAVGFYTQALALLPPVDREGRWQVLLRREEALGVLGEAEPWKADITALLDQGSGFANDHYLAEAYIRQAVFGMHNGDMPTFFQASRNALAVSRRCGEAAIEAKALALVARAEITSGDKTAAMEQIEEALQLARRLGNERVLAYVLYQAAYCYGEVAELAKYFLLQNEQIELDHRLGNTYLGMGLYKQARLLLQQANQISRALGAHRSLAYSLINLGEMYQAIGDLRTAYQVTEEGLREISLTRDVRGQIFALEDLGRVLLAMGDAHGAARRFSEAQDLALSHEMVGESCDIASSQAACAIMLGQPDKARDYVHQAWDYLKGHGWMALNYPPTVYRTCAEVFDALDDTEEAWAVIESAHQAIMELAGKITVPEWQQSFLEDVPDTRAIIEMWERRKH